MHSVHIIKSEYSVGGRRFEPQAEQRIHELAEPAASTLPGVSGDVLLIPEMPSPLGIPDFVALVDGQEWLHNRATTGIPPILAKGDCVVLAALYTKKNLSVPTIAKKIGWEYLEVKSVLTRLERIEAVKSTSGGAYHINPALIPQGSLIALEAKVKDWSKAISQGRSYRTWANNYVVLLGEVGDTAAQRAKYSIAQDRAGLFSTSGWVVRPRTRTPDASKRFRGFEYLYASTVVSSPSLSTHK